MERAQAQRLEDRLATQANGHKACQPHAVQSSVAILYDRIANLTEEWHGKEVEGRQGETGEWQWAVRGKGKGMGEGGEREAKRGKGGGAKGTQRPGAVLNCRRGV